MILRKAKENIKYIVFSLVVSFSILGAILGLNTNIGNIWAESAGYSDAEESVYPVRLDLNLVDVKTKIIGNTIVQDNQSTIVETVYTARARALGGDLYLPAYREDVVTEAVITIPENGSNAVVPGLTTIEILRELPKSKGKYLLHEYEEVTLRIKVVFKVLPKAMPPRLVFSTRLNTVLWYPAAYENGQNDPGLDQKSGSRLIQIPLINATYIPQQVTRAEWQTEPIVLIKNNKTLNLLKETIKENGLSGVTQKASVSNIFNLLRNTIEH